MNDSKSDIQHREALSEVSYLMTLFQTNNRGQLPTISNGNLTGFEAYLEESSLNYSVIGFESFEESEFATDEAGLYSIPNDQIYVFYKTECQNNLLSPSDSAHSFAVVHSNSSNDGYFCNSNQ